ncbi:amylo-alpha-1,6-glucosidase [soil metagenome]
MSMELFVRATPATNPGGLHETEWLLTAGQGGFAMGTVSGVPSRRYHGLLVASLRPPVRRIMALSMIAEQVVVSGGGGDPQSIDLWRARFRPGDVHPAAPAALVRFEKDATCRWTFEVSLRTGGTLDVVKHLALVRGSNTAVVSYEVKLRGAPKGTRAALTLRPLVALRDFHSLVLRDTAREWFRVDQRGARLAVQSPQGALVLGADGSSTVTAKVEENWWFNFQYNAERDRGYDHLEDLFCPGSFAAEFEGGAGTLTLSASMDTEAPGTVATAGARAPAPLDPAALGRAQSARLDAIATHVRSALGGAQQRGGEAAGPLERVLDRLVAAADDFVVQRGGVDGKPRRATIIAGYPWFADWGRDSMIALPGLLLVTGRHGEARDVLRVFAAARKDGLIPNLFDDYSGDAHYNTVDASLWFLNACCEYLRVTDDREMFSGELLPACRDVVESFARGTSFNIRVDPEDGLVSAGTPQTQLTWMDAKRDGVIFTPRCGKPVEINALWYCGLRRLAAASGEEPHAPARGIVGKAVALASSLGRRVTPIDEAFAARCTELAARAGPSFAAKFWNPDAGCLFDVLTEERGGWRGEGEIRPNQLFAVSLPFSPLAKEQQRAVVTVCRRELLTRHAVRTLARGDGRYRGRYRGKMFERDAAYHNGTAWPWLMGAMAEAIARSADFAPAACDDALNVLRPLLGHLDSECLGQIAEVFDGDDDPPMVQQPGGCPAQAWSVAETLRVATLLTRAKAGLLSADEMR